MVENRAGAGGNIGAEVVYKADPDGHTLLFTAGGVLTINKALYGKVSFQPESFVPVSLVAASYSVLVVNPKVPAQSVSEFIAYARANPTKLDYASPGPGTGSHLTAELFKSTAGVHITHIPYKGGAPAMADLLAGQVPLTFAELGTALPHIRAGKLRALAVTSEKRNPSLPGVPTVSETLPGFVATPWNGMVAPPQTPMAIARRISASVAQVLKQPEFAKRLAERNFAPMGSTPEEMGRFVKQEIDRWEKVIRSLGLKVN